MAIAAVLITAVALRLLAGPIDVDFLRTRIGQEFDTPAGKMRVHADRVFVEWSSLSQPMRLVLAGLRVTNASDLTVATARDPSKLAALSAMGCETLQLDVTDEASRKAAVADVERRDIGNYSPARTGEGNSLQ